MTILPPKTGISASTFLTKIFNTRVGESRKVSGTKELEDGVQSQIVVNNFTGVRVDNGGGRESRISCNGRECVVVSRLRCGTIWNRVSCGVAR